MLRISPSANALDLQGHSEAPRVHANASTRCIFVYVQLPTTYDQAALLMKYAPTTVPWEGLKNIWTSADASVVIQT
jgi:hypothetical protein